MQPKQTPYAAAMTALGAAAAAFDRAKALGLVWLDEEQGTLFAGECGAPKMPPPDQLQLDGMI